MFVLSLCRKRVGSAESVQFGRLEMWHMPLRTMHRAAFRGGGLGCAMEEGVNVQWRRTCGAFQSGLCSSAA